MKLRLSVLTQAFFAEGGSPGLAVAVRHSGRQVFEMYLGVANAATGQPVVPQTQFQAGSITKQFTAVATLLLLAERGIPVDSRLSDVMPVPAKCLSGVTIRGLLSHTSGISSAIDREMLAQADDRFTLDYVVSRLAGPGSRSADGCEFVYSNTGYFLLGHVIERLSGMPLHDFVESRLFRQISLSDREAKGRPANHRSVATGHVHSTEGFRNVRSPTPTAAFGSGDICMSARDLGKWGEHFWYLRTFGTQLPDKIGTPTPLRDGSVSEYGLGAYVNAFGGHREISHDGCAPGFSAQLVVYPKAQISIAVMLNSALHRAEEFAKRAASVLLAVPLETSEQSVREDVDLQQFAGTYLLGDTPVEVFERAPDLVIRTPAGRVAKLQSRGNGQFAESENPAMSYEFAAMGSSPALFVSRFGKRLALLRRSSAG